MINQETGEILDGDLQVMEEFMPSKPAVIAIWRASDHEMASWDLETFTSSAKTVLQAQTATQWILGKLARGVVTAWGKDSLGQFAKEIDVNRSSLAVYRWVAEAFKDCPEPDLTLKPFSFYQLAASTDDPMDWIVRSYNDNWTWEKLKYEIDVVKGKIREDDGEPLNKPKVVRCEHCDGWRIINTDKICGGHKDALEQLEDDEQGGV